MTDDIKITKGKVIKWAIISLLLMGTLVVGTKFAQLGWRKYFGPVERNIEREVFEESKSYTHGAIADIAKYYDEWRKADSQEDKQAVEMIVKARFAAFDATNIKSDELRRFFTNARGY